MPEGKIVKVADEAEPGCDMVYLDLSMVALDKLLNSVVYCMDEMNNNPEKAKGCIIAVAGTVEDVTGDLKDEYEGFYSADGIE